MLRPTTLGTLLLLIAAAVAISSVPASAEELVTDGSFETGLGDWTAIDGELSLATSSHSGDRAVQLSGTAAYDAEMFELIPVTAGESYDLSAWVSADPQSIDRVRLRLRWIGDTGAAPPIVQTMFDPWGTDNYKQLATGTHVAPVGTTSARISVLVTAITFPFSVLVDDISLEGPRPAPPTPTASPTDPPPAPSATAAPSVSPTPTPTPTSTPSPPPQTTTPTPATPEPTAAPTPPPTPQRTPGPTPGPTPPPTPPPTPLPTPGAPVVFSQLANGGFEDDGADGSPLGWRKIGGAIKSVSSPVRSGSRALALTSQTTATKWAYQTVQVDGGQFYRANAFALYTDLAVEAVFIRVSWYASADGGGQALSSVDSETMLNTASPAFRALTTGSVLAPADASSARVRLMLRPASGSQASAYFDDVSFAQTDPPPETPAPTATATPPPGATAAPDPATPTPAPPAEPQLFPALTNGGFEDVREDGTPYAWRKVGGEIAATDTAHVDGDLALQFVSRTPSTKWAFQVVTVEAGRAYEFAGFAAVGDGAPEAFLRVSWYTSVDGAGLAIASEDSLPASSATAAFQHLTTGAIEAPTGAQSARLRLMLRPASAARTAAYFDSLSFGEAAVILGDPALATLPAPTAEGEPGGAPPTAPGAVAPAPRIANVTPVPAHATTEAGGGDNTLLYFLGSLAVPFVGLAIIGAIELSRHRETTRR